MRSLLIALLALLSQPVAAAAETPLDARVTHVAQQLRCLVCQNQTIADSNAQLALDLKKEVRAQLERGRSEQDVVDFMVQRYGDFVLYRPPLHASTVLLWAGPFLLLLLGVSTLFTVVRRRQRASVDVDTAPEDRLRGAALLAGRGLKEGA